MEKFIRKGQRGIRKLGLAAFPFLRIKEEKLFPCDLIAHFSYHKCLTVYYNRITLSLSQEFGFFQKHFQSDICAFEKCALHDKGKRVLSVNNQSGSHFDQFPPYKGSHFIRDPRDLIVSGYKYHLWTNEKWCNDPDFGWSKITNHPLFSAYIENDRKRYPKNISYKEYINQLDKDKGFILELIWRQPHFSQMKQWDFHNPNIIELKFEEIIGNEPECFKKIFTHYEFHPKLIKRGVEIAEYMSLKNQLKSKTGHIRKGTAKQWVSEFTPRVKEVFKETSGDLLIALGYENNIHW